MSGSAPSDVAVAFRSFPRRLAAELAGAEDDAHRTSAGPFVRQLEALVRSTADRLGVPSGGSAADVAAAVADAIDGRPADRWTADDLDAIRAASLEGGRLLRQIAGAVSG
jgi:hypothetical protein